MSFILDALKKLEREKESARPGMVMVGPVTWGGRDRRGRGWLLAAAGVGLVAVVALGGWWLGAGRAPSSGPVEESPGAPPESPSTPALPASTVQESPIQAPPAGSRVVASPARATDDLPPEAPTRLPEPPRALPTPADEVPSPARAVVEPATPGEEAAAGPEAEPLDEPPLVAEEQAPQPEFRLTAISERDGEPIALLNDRLVHEGDRFGNILVVRIGATEVEIEVDGERKVIGF